MIYFLLFFLLIVLSIINIVKNDNGGMLLTSLPLVLFMIVLAGIRYNTGPDFPSYKEIFEITSANFLPYYGEPLFATLNYVIGQINSSYNFFLLCIATIAISCKVFFISKYSPYFYVSFLLYFVTNYLSQDFGQIRQGLAIGIAFIGIHFLLKGAKRTFIAIVVTATLIHFSAFIFLLALFKDAVKLSIHKMLVVWVICFFFSSVLSHFSSLITVLGLAGRGNVLGDKLSYLNNDNYGNKIVLNLGMLFKIFILYASTYFNNRYPSRNEKMSSFINLYFIGGCIFFVFSFVEIYAGRFSLYFLIFEIILIPFIISNFKEAFFRFMIFVFFSSYALYLLYQQLYQSKGSYLIPYHHIF